MVYFGSTQNFLDSQFVKLAKLKVNGGPNLHVKVVNGGKLLSKGRCEESHVKIRGDKFSVSFHLLTLGGCDVVLDVQWLGTLRPIIWDFM